MSKFPRFTRYDGSYADSFELVFEFLREFHTLANSGSDTGNGNCTIGQVYTIEKPATFEDVPKTRPFYRYIEAVYKAGVTSGCSQSPKL